MTSNIQIGSINKLIQVQTDSIITIFQIATTTTPGTKAVTLVAKICSLSRSNFLNPKTTQATNNPMRHNQVIGKTKLLGQ